MPLVLWRMGASGSAFWLPWLTLPVAGRLVRRVYSERGRALNGVLKGTSQLHLLYSSLLALSFLAGRP
jgi:1,4-dihydroxy-2-naphthoate octaprenyltransferase